MKGRKRKGKKRNKKKRRRNGKKRNRKNKKVQEKKNFKKETKPNDDISPKQSACDDCVVMLASYSKLFEGKAEAVSKQFNRIVNFERLRSFKRDKRTSFSSPYSALLSALEDKASPKCDGKTVEAGSAEQEFVTALNTLETCEAEVESKCPVLLTQEDNVTITACSTAAKSFKGAMSGCMDEGKFNTTSAICDCIKAISTADVETLKSCNIQPLSKQQKEKKNECVTCKSLKLEGYSPVSSHFLAFSLCKTAEDTSVTGLNTCRKPYVCAGANSKGAAEEELENLNKWVTF